MQVRADKMHGAVKTAESDVEFNEYCGGGIDYSEQTCDAINAEEARVATKFEDHNAGQKKRPCEGVVCENLLSNMQQFQGMSLATRSARGGALVLTASVCNAQHNCA